MKLLVTTAFLLSMFLFTGCGGGGEGTDGSSSGISYKSSSESSQTKENTPSKTPEGIQTSDSDNDGVMDSYDKFPSDAARISEVGFYYESWDATVTSVEGIVNGNLLNTIPQISEYRSTSIDLPISVGDNYVQRVRAYIVPSQTADYYFYVSADDRATVWLSENSSDNGEDPIIELKNFTNHNDFTKYSSQKSERIRLEANKPYYLEIISFEGGGGDNLSLAWSTVENGYESDIEVVSADNLQQFYFPSDSSVPPVAPPMDITPPKTETLPVTAPVTPPSTVTDPESCAKEYFTKDVTPLLTTCFSCHKAGGIAASTAFVIKSLNSNNDAANYVSVKEYIEKTGQKIIQKNNGTLPHAGSSSYDVLKSIQMDTFVSYVQTPSECKFTEVLPPVTPPVVVEPAPVVPPIVVAPPAVTEPAPVSPPAMTSSHDKDKDGVFDVLDKYPNDASKISDQGFLYEMWSQGFDTLNDALIDGVFDTDADVKSIKTGDLDGPVNVGNDYVQRHRAYLKPKVTGDYYLYVAVDDGAKVYISPDVDMNKKALIIETERWTSHNQFKKHSEQKSELIKLEAGKSYYVEMLGREGGGGDNLSLGYSMLSNGTESSVQVVSADMIVAFYIPEGLSAEDFGDLDNDGIPTYLDDDADNDGVLNDNDAFPKDGTESADSDNDGLGDNRDTDDDNDGVLDADDLYPLDASKSSDAVAVATLNVSVLQAKCVVCHSSTGPASFTDVKFRQGNTNAVINHNETELSFYITGRTDGGQLLLDKSRGLKNHGGGSTIALGSTEYTLLTDFVNKFSTSNEDVMSNDGTYTIESKEKTYRRASLYLTGEIPSQAKVQSMASASDDKLRTEILALMKGEGFHDFLKDGANDRIHSRHHKTSDNGTTEYNKFYKKNTDDSRTQVRQDLAEEPLELIAYIVENDLPYSEILTADYTMVGQYTDESYNTGLNLAAGEWKKSKNKGHEIKTEMTYGDDATGNNRLSDYPHAGVLSTWAFLSKYPTTATNRNRTRANWTMQHFLGYNIEKSAARTLDISELGDEENPIMNNSACTSCHQTMDPIAGAFKYFHERVGYKAYGTDSLDGTYRRNNVGVNNWYHDVLPAGYRGENAPTSGDPLQWLAKRLVEDYRFAESVVKFWWLPVFGENVLDSESADADHFNTQSVIITALANDFRNHMNLKQLLADMMMSDTFRAEHKANATMADNDVSLHMGARHLLTPRVLKNKTESLTGFVWGNTNPKLDKDYYMLYGGIDDISVESRPSDLSNIMFKVAERQALEIGCAVVVYDFDFDKNERRLFTEVERDTLDELSIKRQIIVLFERMLNREVGLDSEQVAAAYALFMDLQEAHRNQGGNSRINTSGTRCDNRKSGSTDDTHHVLAPWRGLVIALMTDPDYLYE